MSIILKGIDLPDEKLMEMFESDNHICIGGNYYPLMIKDVIQIPKGHGRIIDASELIKSYMKGTKTDIDDFYDTIDIIDNAPTILEAEE